MVVIPAPAAAKNRLALSGEVVGEAKTRLPEKRPGRETAQRGRWIALVPNKTAVLQRRATGAVLRIVKNRIAVAQAIDPRLDVGRAHSQLQCQSARNLPGILDKKLILLVSDVVNPVEGSLLVRVQRTGGQIGISVTQSVGISNVGLQ